MEKWRVSFIREWASWLSIYLSRVLRVSVCLKFVIILAQCFDLAHYPQITHLRTMAGGTQYILISALASTKNLQVRIGPSTCVLPNSLADISRPSVDGVGPGTRAAPVVAA